MLEVGCGTGTFTRRFLEQFRPEEMVLNDICPEVEEALADLLTPEAGESTPQISFTAGDAELCSLPGDRDLIVSCSVLQWFEDPGAFIARCRTLAHGGGCIALTTFGPDNLQEVTAVTGTGLSYLPLGCRVAARTARRGRAEDSSGGGRASHPAFFLPHRSPAPSQAHRSHRCHPHLLDPGTAG